VVNPTRSAASENTMDTSDSSPEDNPANILAGLDTALEALRAEGNELLADLDFSLKPTAPQISSESAPPELPRPAEQYRHYATAAAERAETSGPADGVPHALPTPTKALTIACRWGPCVPSTFTRVFCLWRRRSGEQYCSPHTASY
jgi:hypothetical protein